MDEDPEKGICGDSVADSVAPADAPIVIKAEPMTQVTFSATRSARRKKKSAKKPSSRGADAAPSRGEALSAAETPAPPDTAETPDSPAAFPDIPGLAL